MLFVELTLPVDKLQKLRPREKNGVLESLWQEVASPVLLVEELVSLLLEVHLVFVTFLAGTIMKLLQLNSQFLLSHLVPTLLGLLVLLQILDLLDIKNHRHLQLV